METTKTTITQNFRDESGDILIEGYFQTENGIFKDLNIDAHEKIVVDKSPEGEDVTSSRHVGKIRFTSEIVSESASKEKIIERAIELLNEITNKENKTSNE